MSNEMVDEQAADVAAPAEDKETKPVVETPETPETPDGEAKPETKPEAPDPDEDDGDEDKPAKRASRSQRQSRKIQLLASENAELRRVLESGPRTSEDRPQQTEAKEQPPKEAEFNGDYLAYERALNAWNTKQAVQDAVRREVETARARERHERQAEARNETVAAHMDRVDEARERITDFDQVLKAGGQAQVAPQVAAEILESDKSALIQYYLAKNPDKLNELNSMSGRELAKEVGRLEGRVHLPKSKQVTQATPPLAAVKGGAAPAFDPFKSQDMGAYIKWRAGGGGK